MLTSLRIRNFKAWKDTGDVRLAPLTVIFGANSAGKSSLGHLLLALQQTAQSSDRKRALHLGDKTTLIDLGTFSDCLHGHDLGARLAFDLGWNLVRPLDVRDPLKPEARYVGNHLSLSVELAAGKTGQPEVGDLRYDLRRDGEPVLDIALQRGEGRKFSLHSEKYTFRMTDGRKWPLEEPEKFYRASDLTLARFKNAGFLSDFALATESMLDSITYLGPLRQHPERTYQWSGDTPQSVGQMGEFTIAAILGPVNATEEPRPRVPR